MNAIEEKAKVIAYSNKDFMGDCTVALEELMKLHEYYKSEIKQRKNELRKITKQDIRWEYEQGKIVAYTDHITEIEYIIEMMAGRKKSE